jgi:hypothetical protein
MECSFLSVDMTFSRCAVRDVSNLKAQARRRDIFVKVGLGGEQWKSEAQHGAIISLF